MKVKIIGILTVLAMLLNMFTVVSAASNPNSEENTVEDLLNSMSLRDKVTQMMMVDFRKWGSSAEEASDFTEMNDEVYSIVEEYNFGAVILFSNSMFSGLVFCKDCGSKLYFCTAQKFTKEQNWFTCAKARKNKEQCTAHFI